MKVYRVDGDCGVRDNMKYWINRHHRLVIEKNGKRWGTVIPLTKKRRRLVRGGKFIIGPRCVFFFGDELMVEIVSEDDIARNWGIWMSVGG